MKFKNILLGILLVTTFICFSIKQYMETPELLGTVEGVFFVLLRSFIFLSISFVFSFIAYLCLEPEETLWKINIFKNIFNINK